MRSGEINNFFDLDYQPVLKAICARDGEKAAAFAKRWGYESVETDWRKLVERPDIDIIDDIATPNDTHAAIAIAATKAGKMILCEKPLSMDGKQGEEMVKVIEKAKVPNMVWYNYRRVPAVTLAKQLIDEGKLGKVFHYRAKFLQDWTISKDLPQGGAGLWRLDVKSAGSGVTGDLLAHCIDTALWLNGSIGSVTAMTETFVKERKHTLTGKVQKVGIDDACAFLARFNNGSLATFESTRYARSHKALYTFARSTARIPPSRGTTMICIGCNYFDHRRRGRVCGGWRSIPSPTAEAILSMKKLVGAGVANRLRALRLSHQVADFPRRFRQEETGAPRFPRRGSETQYVCDAVS